MTETSGPGSTGKGKLSVFISYARADLGFADQLDAALDAFAPLLEELDRGVYGAESRADMVAYVRLDLLREPLYCWSRPIFGRRE